MEKTSTSQAIGKIASYNSWLCIKYIRIYRKLDSGDEEFQYFFVPNGNPNPQGGNVNPDGKFECDNNPRQNPPVNALPVGEPARIASFAKVSTNGRSYDPSLALFPISSGAYQGVTFVESDYQGLKLYKGGTDVGAYDIYTRKQYYKWLPANGAYGWHYQKYITYGPAPAGKADDFYTGEVLGINQISVSGAITNYPHCFDLPLRVNGLGQLITHLRVQFRPEILPY